MKKNNAFTLIELMVVIVIIGILAAIGIPKLFGMTAKAKASEVGPAAGTWSKTIASYYTETGSLGNWVDIGYNPPGEKQSGSGVSRTNAFEYEDVDYGASTLVGHWQAKAIGVSKSCDGLFWKVHSDGLNSTVDLVGCPELTPHFSQLK